MQRDHWGYHLSTESADAATAQIKAYQSFSRWRTDMMLQLDNATAADPDFALPYVMKGLIIASLRKPELMGKAQALFDKASAARPPESAREKLYFKALNENLAGRLCGTINAFDEITMLCPHDLFAHRQAQAELFWQGEVEWMRDINDRAANVWTKDVPGFAHYQAIRAFGLEETGNYAEAERCAREAVELDPAECWGAHAMAHILVMQARLDEGVDWINDLTGNWDGCNHIVHHNWWHLALFHCERGDYQAALDIYDNRLRDLNSPLMQAMPDYFVDLQNDVAILQRLELRGVDAGSRWEPIADLAQAWTGNTTSGFTAAHAALALAAAGRFAAANELVEKMAARIAADEAGDIAGKLTLATLPTCKAAIAFRRHDHQTVLDVLYPVRRQLWHMGGSHAQRDLFFQLLWTSAYQLGEIGKLGVIRAELETLGFEHMDERTSYREVITEHQIGHA